MRSTIDQLLATARKAAPFALASLIGSAPAEELIPTRTIWDNGAFDTVQFSGSLTSTHASGDDFRLERETVIGSLTLWAHDLGPLETGGPVGDLDELDTIAETLSVAFYSDGSGVPGALIATREIENAELCDTGALAPNDEHIFQIDGVFTEPLQLPAGDYWFIVRNGAWGSPAGGPTNMVIRGTQTQTMTAA